MRLRNFVLAAMFPLTGLFLEGVATARMQGRGPMNGMSCYGPMGMRTWNAEALQTLEGRIKDIKVDSSCMRHGEFLSLQITVDGKDYLVRMGPVSFVNSKKLGIALGADIRVKGLPLTNAEEPAFVASEITIKGQTFKLRDDEGRPLWSRRAKGGVS